MKTHGNPANISITQLPFEERHKSSSWGDPHPNQYPNPNLNSNPSHANERPLIEGTAPMILVRSQLFGNSVQI